MAGLWWVNAFVGPDAGGNATCVVMETDQGSAIDRAGVARALRAPDTTFVAPGARPDEWRVRFFSPDEGEMAFCGQALIATDAVLRAVGASAPRVPLRLSTMAGPVSTRADESSGLTWFTSPRALIQRRAGGALAPLVGGAPAPVVVDSGRQRLFQRLERADDIEGVRLEPDEVLRLCDRHDVKGVCFYAQAGAAGIALRVFTVSLAGREDASTGGAVLALCALLPQGLWTIAQGRGRYLGRGALMLDSASSNDEVSVGGRVELVARGGLAG